MSNFPTLYEASLISEEANKLNPGLWVNHKRIFIYNKPKPHLGLIFISLFELFDLLEL